MIDDNGQRALAELRSLTDQRRHRPTPSHRLDLDYARLDPPMSPRFDPRL
jgi:hypothetical protein